MGALRYSHCGILVAAAIAAALTGWIITRARKTPLGAPMLTILRRLRRSLPWPTSLGPLLSRRRRKRPIRLANDPSAVAEGHKLFISMNCAGCHGYDAKGGMGPNLTDTYWRYGGTPERLYETILNGRPKGMPAWGRRCRPNRSGSSSPIIQSLGGTVSPGMAQAAAREICRSKGQNKGASDQAMKRLRRRLFGAVSAALRVRDGAARVSRGPAGPAARALAGLGWGLIAISAAVCLIVLGLFDLCNRARACA